MDVNLNNQQIKTLKKLAHHLEPSVMIGQQGVTPSVLGKINESLSSHELIKVKFVDFKDEKQELVREITEKTQSELVTIIGHVAVLFRQNADEEKRKVTV